MSHFNIFDDGLLKNIALKNPIAYTWALLSIDESNNDK